MSTQELNEFLKEAKMQHRKLSDATVATIIAVVFISFILALILI